MEPSEVISARLWTFFLDVIQTVLLDHSKSNVTEPKSVPDSDSVRSKPVKTNVCLVEIFFGSICSLEWEPLV